MSNNIPYKEIAELFVDGISRGRCEATFVASPSGLPQFICLERKEMKIGKDDLELLGKNVEIKISHILRSE